MTSRTGLRNHIWQACTAIRNEHRDVKKYVEYTAVLLFIKFYDDLYDTLPSDVQRLIPDRYRWGTLKSLDPRGFAGFNSEVLLRLREFFQEEKWRGQAAFGAIFENFAFDIKHDEVLGQALIALDRIDFSGMDYDQKGDLYEFLIAKMADAGVKGEFFTPRSVVDAIIALTAPRAGMRVWDPACGTAGFLARAFEEMRTDLEESSGGAHRIDEEALHNLRTRSIYGCETEAVSARLARMNMLLRGDGHSTILEFNSLDRQTYTSRTLELRGRSVPNPLPSILREGGFDRIMANPPYGGSQAVSDAGTLFRPWTSTKKPEANFLQVMMSALAPGGVCAAVLPEGVLFRREEAALRERLLRDYDLRAIVGLYQGAFEFADVKACILVFRRPLADENWTGTHTVWVGDAKTAEHIRAIPDSVGSVTSHGRPVEVAEIRQNGGNLRPQFYVSQTAEVVAHALTIRDLFDRAQEAIEIEDGQHYKQITVRTSGRGAVLRKVAVGSEIGTKRQYLASAGDLIVSRIDARHGAYALIPESLSGGVVTGDFPLFRAKDDALRPELLGYFLRYGKLWERFSKSAQGSTNRQRVSVEDILDTYLPVPSDDEQDELLLRLRRQHTTVERAALLLEGFDRYEWLDESMFRVPSTSVVASSFGSLVQQASAYVDPSSEPTAEWTLYSLTNRDGVQRGETKMGRDFTPGRRYKRLVEGAVTYDTRRVNVGSVGIMPPGDSRSIMSPYRVVMRCHEGLDPQFLVFAMKSPFFLDRVRKAQVGAVRDELFFNVFCQIPFEVPCLQHQREIVRSILERRAAYEGVRRLADEAATVAENIVADLFAAGVEWSP